MTELLSLLNLFYACDIAAETRFPTPQEWATCMGYYAQIKALFAPELSGPEAQMEGYLRWKAWEAENAALVAEMRENARL